MKYTILYANIKIGDNMSYKVSRPYNKEYIDDYPIADYNRYLNYPGNLTFLKNNYFYGFKTWH